MAAFDFTTETTPTLAGRYRVIERIASGGTATVLIAEDELLRRRVAIKRLRVAGSPDDERRILREARVGAGLSHPALATIFDVIADENGTLVVMQYIEGRPLLELIPDSGLDPRHLVDILRPVASALDYAHRHGVVHRDVKPSNILISEAGEVKLVDLGAATAPDATRITSENKVIGTLAYIAPERLTGDDPGGPAADIYSLAVTAFRALTGALPLTATTPAEALAGLAAGPPSLRDRLPSAPAGLALAIARGMERDPRRRQRSALELVAQIEVATRAAPVPPGRPRPAPPAAPPSAVSSDDERERRPTVLATSRGSRGRALLAIAAAVVALGLAAAAVFGLGGGASSPDHRRAGGPSAGAGRSGGGKATGAGSPATAASSASGTPTRAATATPTGPPDPARGSALNDRGYALIQAGDYAAAVPILRRAVAAFPRDSTELVYGYALFNLAHALRLSGHPAAAIPLLRRRLRIPDQTATVRAELATAEAEAGS
jgi:eukaryotic-like serine/threonine-protein kinase